MAHGKDDPTAQTPDRVSPSPDEPLTRPLLLELGLRIVEHELRERARLYELLAES
ncbi:MAG: hypothetical protein OXN81_07305 [Alphaproteobacteria bacterium]|nr:hypothetical protein [Alphaproteobacteria bacterium]